MTDAQLIETARAYATEWGYSPGVEVDFGDLQTGTPGVGNITEYRDITFGIGINAVIVRMNSYDGAWVGVDPN
jgi:hypothetical protein